MTKENIKRISLDEIIRMKEAGELPAHDPNAEPGEDLPDEFWDNAVLVDHREPTDVHLKLDPLTFAWFKQHGSDPATHMQNVLRDYVSAELRKRRKKPHPDAAE